MPPSRARSAERRNTMQVPGEYRAEMNRALAKALAYKNCGKENEAEAAARELIHLLVACDILRDPLEV